MTASICRRRGREGAELARLPINPPLKLGLLLKVDEIEFFETKPSRHKTEVGFAILNEPRSSCSVPVLSYIGVLLFRFQFSSRGFPPER